MSLIHFAKTEFDILNKLYPDPDNGPLLAPYMPEILALVEKFAKQGHSGGSAGIVGPAIASAIKKLLAYSPIAPLTGEAHEWNNAIDEDVWQNNRCPAVFKTLEHPPYYLDAIIWEEEDGVGINGRAYYTLKEFDMTSSGIKERPGRKVQYSSGQTIKGFPFEPKTFHVKCVTRNGERWISDIEAFQEACNYYDVRPIE
jgi:hypothetical protein